MADDFDPCECICSTDWAMRRLLSMLRTSQQYCTDNECFTEMPGTSSMPNNPNGMFFMFFMWMIVLLALFVYRPASMRRPIGPHKNHSNDRGNNPPPPDVPPVE